MESAKKLHQPKMTADEFSRAQLTQPCWVCQILGHWADHRNPDKSLKPGTLSIDPNSVKTSVDAKTTSGTKNIIKTSYISKSNQSQPPVIGFLAKVSPNLTEMPSPSTSTLIWATSTPSCSSSISPIVDDGTPFSEIGEAQLRFHRKRLVGGYPTSRELNDCTHWPFGVGAHSSPRRKILGSVLLKVLTDSGLCVNTTYGTLS